MKNRRLCCTQSQLVFKPLWNCLGLVGMRRCFQLLQKTNPAYRDTINHFDPPHPLFALTIDDGLCRGGPDHSLVEGVLQVLKRHNAHATFFVCTDYVEGQNESVQALLEQGHELGNHLQADKLWYYPKLEKEAFRAEFQEANRILQELEDHYGQDASTTKTRWFRAPQGIMNQKMQQVVAEDETTTHVLGDCYCDDWCFAQDVDPLFDNPDNNPKRQKQRETVMKQVANLMLKQVRKGGVAIFHMPEKGFRQGNLLALGYFLRGLQDKGLTCVNLTEIQKACLEHKADDTGECGASDNNVSNKFEPSGRNTQCRSIGSSNYLDCKDDAEEGGRASF